MRYTAILLIICFCFPACAGKKKGQGDVVLVDGEEIPIQACVETNSKILGNSVDPVAFCKCLIPKVYAEVKNDPEKLKMLRDGDWSTISKDKQDVMTQHYKNCMTATATNSPNAKFTVTPHMAEGIKRNMKNALAGSDIERSNNVDEYCDCMLYALQNDFIVGEVMQDSFNSTKKYRVVMDSCMHATRKKE